MRHFFRDRPIHHKLNLIVGLVMSLAFAGTFISVANNERDMLERETIRAATTMARLVAANAQTSLMFQDSNVAAEILATLYTDENVLAGVIFSDGGGVLAQKVFRGDSATLPLAYPTAADDGAIIDKDLLKVAVPIGSEGMAQGKALLLLDLTYHRRQIEQNLWFTSSIFGLSFLLAFALAGWLQRAISRPLAALSGLMDTVSNQQNYALRAEADSHDEIGCLARRCNAMLEIIQLRTDELERYQQHLEKLVEERTRELTVAKDAAEAASRAKSQFLANMSHELRTPLAGVIGLLEVLQSTPLDPTQLSYMGKASGAAEMLLSVINDILDFSKIEAGRMELEHIDFDVIEVVEQCAALFAETAHHKGVEMLCSVPLDVQRFLRGDPVRLRQVLSNLLGNAIKFTPHGEISINLEILEQEETRSHLRITVRDTGIGIAPEKLPHLFDAFTQADGSTTRQYGGTGLGLAIVRQLVMLMGGEISVSSTVGRGSAFILTLTLAHGKAQPLTQHPLPGMRVLVVDDNANNRLILQRYLEHLRVAVELESDSLLAVDRMRQAKAQGQPFDTVLLDFQMPGMDGLAVAHAIQGDATLADTDVVMLSSVSLSPQQVKAAGVRTFLMKPVHRRELHQVLVYRHDHAAGAGRDSAESAPPVAVPATAQPPTAATTRGIRILLVDDNPTNLTVAKAMLNKLGHQAATADNGLEALQFLERNEVDCIFMDCLMPVMDGYEATRAIRNKEQRNGRHTPIIALTANALQDDRERCLAAGMDDYLTKPFKSQQIQETLQHWVPQLATVSWVTTTDVAALAAPGAELLNNAVLNELQELLGNEAADFLAMFQSNTGQQLRIAKAALAQGDTAALRTAVHTLKGSAGAVGATSLQEACLALEQQAKSGKVEQGEADLEHIEQLLQAVAAALQQRLQA